MNKASDIRLLLAPMEGVTDWVMRDLLTSIGGIDQCVTEFLRVTDKLHPESVFYKNCPELRTGSRTRSGTPVFVQLLGGQADALALNAQRAHKLGALGIDLNFGCPAKTVNRHDGGASLLKSSERLYKIVKAVREAVPQQTPVTAKIRLGFDDPAVCLENSVAISEAGATWLTVHCRTKTDGYRPPAYWDWIPRIQEKTPIKIIANGEIWNLADFQRCQEVSGCQDFMIGRGALTHPHLFRQIKAAQKDSNIKLDESEKNNFSQSWKDIKHYIPGFFEASTSYINEHFATSRTKMWMKQLSIKDPEAKAVFDQIKILKKPTEFRTQLYSLTTGGQ